MKFSTSEFLTQTYVKCICKSTDFAVANATPTNFTFIASLNNDVTTFNNNEMSSATTSNGEFKVIRGEHKVKLRGSIEEEEPPRRLGLFEIYGILLVSHIVVNGLRSQHQIKSAKSAMFGKAKNLI